jgi:hypothetical protein
MRHVTEDMLSERVKKKGLFTSVSSMMCFFCAHDYDEGDDDGDLKPAAKPVLRRSVRSEKCQTKVPAATKKLYLRKSKVGAKQSKAATSNITKYTLKTNTRKSRGAAQLKAPPEQHGNPLGSASIPPAPLSVSLPPDAAATSADAVASIPTPLPQPMTTTDDTVPFPHDDEMEVILLGDGDTSQVPELECNILPPLKSIWDCDMLNRVEDHKSAWHC